jgi:Uncharacterized protein conserved in bacteria (DUF2087)
VDPITSVQVPTGLASLVAKDGVHLGTLAAAERALVLTWIWAGLPRASEQAPLGESAINQALKAQLSGAARFLATDHVELRRWLVDGGYLQRDGFGRAYQRVAVEQVPLPSQPAARTLEGLDTEAWTRERHQQIATARAERRAAWQASQQAKQGAGP